MKPPRPPLGSIWDYHPPSMMRDYPKERQCVVIAVNYTQSVSGNYMVIFDNGQELNLSEFNRYVKQEWLKPAGQLTAKMLKLLYGT